MKFKSMVISLSLGCFLAMGSFLADSAQSASVKGKIRPKDVRSEARWKLKGVTGWKRHNKVVKGLDAGDYTVKFKDVAGWDTPAEIDINLEEDEDLLVKGKYEQAMSNCRCGDMMSRLASRCNECLDCYCCEGKVTATMTSSDPEALCEFAYRVLDSDGNPVTDWLESGEASPCLPEGDYTVEFDEAECTGAWICETPIDIAIEIEGCTMTEVTAEYQCDQLPCCPQEIELPKTGQTVKDADCDDGDLEMGADWPIYPQTRFTDNIDGTVTDNLTGLMWEQFPNGDLKSWWGALDYADVLVLGDNDEYDDWRLPNRDELRSLIHYGMYNTARWMNRTFDGVLYDFYWTSTTTAHNSNNAWMINMDNGEVTEEQKSWIFGLEMVHYVIAVRGDSVGAGLVALPKTGQTEVEATGDDGDLQMGVAWPDPRFVDNDDGTVCDNLTGLMWEQAPLSLELIWDWALYYADFCTVGGYSDWRLPNVNELESLLHAGCEDPSIAEWEGCDTVFDNGMETYWTSTTYKDYSDKAWAIDFEYGGIKPIEKLDEAFVWVVRCPEMECECFD